jgi:4-hydroxy 2-oxovalerate aldolase
MSTQTSTQRVDYRLIDSTLRDGSHAISHQYEPEEVIAIVRGLDAAGVQVIEIAHGDGLGGSSFNYGFSKVDEKELIARACDEAKNATIACLLLPGIGLADDLKDVRELGVGMARIATHCTEADISEQHIKTAKELGMETIGFMMMAHMNSPQGLVARPCSLSCMTAVRSPSNRTIAPVRSSIRSLIVRSLVRQPLASTRP